MCRYFYLNNIQCTYFNILFFFCVSIFINLFFNCHPQFQLIHHQQHCVHVYKWHENHMLNSNNFIEYLLSVCVCIHMHMTCTEKYFPVKCTKIWSTRKSFQQFHEMHKFHMRTCTRTGFVAWCNIYVTYILNPFCITHEINELSCTRVTEP